MDSVDKTTEIKKNLGVNHFRKLTLSVQTKRNNEISSRFTSP